MKIAAVDWDGTLYQNGEWMDGSKRALKVLKRRGYTVVIHSSRANFPAGRESIEQALREARLDLRVEPKFQADRYIDNLATEHDGDWSKTLFRIRTQ